MLNSSSSKNSTTVRSERAVRLTRAALQAAYFVSESLGASLAERLFTTPRRYPRPDRERAVLAIGTRFDVDVMLRSPRWAGMTTKVAAWRWGIGPTVLLVHGWEGRGSQLGALVAPLVEAGLSVVAFDAPAHGDSSGSRLYLTDHADAVADVVTAVGPVHAIVAHSFGAAAVLLAGARHGVDISRNVMISPNVIIDESLVKFARAVALDDRDRDGFERRIVLASGVALGALSVEALAGKRDAALLVVHDRNDREVGVKHGDRLAAAWPNAQLVLTDELGHRRILRDDAVIARVVDFVRTGLPLPASDLVRELDRLLTSHH
jgi:pimeloyl-ACP methyl ester carboxylesterase